MSGNRNAREDCLGLRRGNCVTVRSLPEILATLDADAKFEGLPFMPEMVPCCGRNFRVYRRADKTCVEGFGMRSMRNTVFLEGLRCDGSAHGGCQRGCQFYWKEAWLKTAEGSGGDGRREKQASRHEEPAPGKSENPDPQSPVPNLSLSQLPTSQGERFYCQSTELAGATGEFTLSKLRFCLHDLRIGEMTLGRFAYFLLRAMRRRAWRFWSGRSFCQITGEQKETPKAELNLQPNEMVEIKSLAEIEATLDTKGRNRGLTFEPEMALHCGRRYRVLTPVRTIISEESGKMLQLTNTVILEGLFCEGICAKNCPRANYFYWREIWLKRV